MTSSEPSFLTAHSQVVDHPKVNLAHLHVAPSSYHRFVLRSCIRMGRDTLSACHNVTKARRSCQLSGSPMLPLPGLAHTQTPRRRHIGWEELGGVKELGSQDWHRRVPRHSTFSTDKCERITISNATENEAGFIEKPVPFVLHSLIESAYFSTFWGV
jgi:hypothetical protein